MATREVVEIRCDRCKRVEYRDIQEVAAGPLLVLTWSGVTLTFKDLCEPCIKTIKNYVNKVATALEGKSPDRAKKKTSLPEGQAPLPPTNTATEPEVGASADAGTAPVLRKKATAHPTAG